MNLKVVAATGIALCLNVALSAMVMHNDAELKENGIRTEAGIFDEDYLFMGHELRFSGQAEDLIFLGKELAFSGKTKLGLLAVGKTVVHSGLSGNGILAGCANLTIDGAIASNSYVGCKSLHLSETGTIDGNLFAGCATLLIDGTINGNLYAGAGEIVINSPINGNVTAYGGRLIIGEKGRISGNLVYSSKEKLSDAELARVAGTTTLDEKHAFHKDDKFPSRAVGAIIGLCMFVSFVVVGSLLLFMPVFAGLDRKRSRKAFWNTALWGLIPFLMYPAVVVLAIAMVVTIPFAAVLLLAFIPLTFFAYVIGTTLAGQYVVTVFKWNVEKRHYHFLIGALAVAVVSAVPFVNFLAFVFISSLGFGVYLSFILNRDLTAGA